MRRTPTVVAVCGLALTGYVIRRCVGSGGSTPELVLGLTVVLFFTVLLVYWAFVAHRVTGKDYRLHLIGKQRTIDRSKEGKGWTEEEIDDPDACWRD